MSITHRAPPKINLSLRITGRRDDGYHELESLVVFGCSESGDCVVYEPEQAYGLSVQGEFAPHTPSDDRNLILKMARLVQVERPQMRIGHFTLTKNLPVAAGIGGGTMDAIAALRCMQEAHDLPADLCLQFATRIGADGAACWYQEPLIMRGIGEQIELLPDWMPPQHILLINPRVVLETAAVFRGYKETGSPLAGELSCDSMTEGGENLQAEQYPPQLRFTQQLPRKGGAKVFTNHLLPAAQALCPAITDILAFLESYKALYANMSGSGATCFGVFETAKDVQRALDAMPGEWWGMIVS